MPLAFGTGSMAADATGGFVECARMHQLCRWSNNAQPYSVGPRMFTIAILPSISDTVAAERLPTTTVPYPGAGQYLAPMLVMASCHDGRIGIHDGSRGGCSLLVSPAKGWLGEEGSSLLFGQSEGSEGASQLLGLSSGSFISRSSRRPGVGLDAVHPQCAHCKVWDHELEESRSALHDWLCGSAD